MTLETPTATADPRVGAIYRVFTSSSVDVLRSPHGDIDTQLLYGEPFRVSEIRDGWAYGAAEMTGYSGWVRLRELLRELEGPDGEEAPTHRVTVNETLLYARSPRGSQFYKGRRIGSLGMNSLVRITGRLPRLYDTDGGWIFGEHLDLIKSIPAKDPAGYAELLVNTPYAWGGRDSSSGVDCSGLVNLSYLPWGIVLPHNVGRIMQSNCGVDVDPKGPYQRNDLVCFERHIGVMTSDTHIVTASADFMRAVEEPLAVLSIRQRVNWKDEVVAVRRFVMSATH